MSTLPVQFPDLESLRTGLTCLFVGHQATKEKEKITILDREPNEYRSSFPSEIVTCQLRDGRTLRLFCKYGVGYLSRNSGHRRGVPYEVDVYREVLNSFQGSTPHFFGAYTDPTTERTCLVMEYLDSSVRLNVTTESDALELAARWIGKFHAANEERVSDSTIPFLNKYDASYYLGWRCHISLNHNNLVQTLPWLPVLFERFVTFMMSWVAGAPTVIHGEFYPNNVLIYNEHIFAVDWETAGIGVGEMDLVPLTQAWPEEMVRKCELAYQSTRWPEGSPAHFDQTLTAAQLYFYFKQLFYWVEFQPDRPAQEIWIFDKLHSAGERLGLI